MSGLVTLVDDALPEALFVELLRGVRRVGARASYWTTFWYPLDGSARCLPEKVAEVLAPLVPEERALRGVEWWIGRMRTDAVPLDFHHDRDLALYEATGRLSIPRWSSVLYLNRVQGGSLVVTDQRLRRRGDDYRLVPAVAGDVASVRPAPNRFVRFDGNRLHGVLDHRDEVPSKKAGKQASRASWRLSLVVNWWHRKPRALQRWSADAAYPELALEASR